jgi:glycosyltransferase involved in cell wall biosynthesis
MKILYLANLRLPTEKAYGVNISETCQALADAGADVKLVYPFRKNPITADFFSYYGVKNNFKTRILPAIDIYFPGKLDKISALIKNFLSGVSLVLYSLWSETDTIYSRDEFPLFLLSFFGKNIYFEAHKFSDSRKFFYRRFLKRKIKVIAISESLKKNFLEMGFGTDDILVAHDSVNLNDFNISVTKEEARNKTGLPLNAKIVMYTGHLFDWKGADVLAKAAMTLPEINFVFVGGTEHDVAVFKDKFGELENIIIMGHEPHKDIPVFLKAADILVLPNSAKQKFYLGTSPIKLFEYMSSMRPVVASDIPSIAEVLNGGNSVLVMPDDPSALADGIKKLMDTNLAGKIAEKAFEDVQLYTWQKRAEKILKFIS